MFALSIVTEDGSVVFDCSEVNFGSRTSCSLGTVRTLMSDGEGNCLAGGRLGGRGGGVFEATSCHLHEEDPATGTRWWGCLSCSLPLQHRETEQHLSSTVTSVLSSVNVLSGSSDWKRLPRAHANFPVIWSCLISHNTRPPGLCLLN